MIMALAMPVEKTKDGVMLYVRATPKASRNAITGIAEGSNQQLELKISVTAVPDGGKANEAILNLLGNEWKLLKSPMRVLSGTTNRHKVILIAGDADWLYEQVLAYLKVF
jgi:uncharacterized protein (TIGR00251 family)